MIDRKNEIINIKELYANYSKFYSTTDTHLDNAKRLLHNYCVRDGLDWAPVMFQTAGKSRTAENINLVKAALSNKLITTVEELINSINTNKLYAQDSSLMKRLVFICLQENIPYQVQIKDEACQLAVGISACHLWKYYPSYSNKINLYDNQEDSDIKGIPISNKLDYLKENELYLYIVTKQGEIFFAPQFAQHLKLTHGALARKAHMILKDTPQLDILSAGTIMKNHNCLYINLASGHYLPDISAYTATLESLANIKKNETLYLQAPHYYKKLELSSCQLVDPINIEDQKTLKQLILYYLSQLKSKDEKNEKTILIEKVFDNILSHDEFSYTNSELETLKNDNTMCKLYDKYSKFFPETLQLTAQQLKPHK